MPIDNKGLLFSHIPKTAGTSLRLAVQRHVRGWKVYADYDVENPTTSRVIRKCYESGDFSRVDKINGPKTLLAGHFPITKYLSYYPIHHVISFVRDPVQRVISHYHDLQRRRDYPESLETFISQRRYQNTQARFFKGVPVEAVGFIGICEFYDESIELINKIFSMSIPVTKFNINKKKKDDFYIATGEIVKQIKDVNQKDCELYDNALKLFHKRKELLNTNKPYTYGKVDTINAKSITGWAVNPGSDEPVKLKLIVNDAEAGSTVANQQIQHLDGINIGNSANVGFTFNLDKTISADDNLIIFVEATGQQLNLSS